jgi:hypothetical protein
MFFVAVDFNVRADVIDLCRDRRPYLAQKMDRVYQINSNDF